MFLTSTAKLADVVLPVRSFIEREGTYTSGERRVQRYYPVLPDRSPLLADFAITGQIGQRLGLDLESRIASRVMARIAASLPDYAGLSYTTLSAVEEQWPIIGRSDLYYGGTTYENRQGLGIQLPPSILQGKPVSLGWPQPPEVSVPKLGLLAFPVTRLYDRGSTLVHSELLHKRLAAPQVIMNPEDAQHLKILDRSTVDLSIFEQHFLVEAHLSPEVPAGVALVPRSMGVPVHEPIAIAVRLAEKVAI
jgi:NADH-quinone oxidoreductase subunit G